MKRIMGRMGSENVLPKSPFCALFLGLYHLSFALNLSFAQTNIVQQQVFLNIPAYNLSLYTQYNDGRWKRLSVPIGVGQGAQRKYQTPTGRGELYAKAIGVTFEYGEQNPPELIGKIITHSNTFDKKTLKPIRIKMPDDMKSIFMRLYSDIDSQYYTQFVLHETTDWYTVGAPASKGCIRMDREDMLRFYRALDPLIQEGPLSNPVQIIIYYDVCEYYPEQKMVILHANIYYRSIDYVHEVLHDLKEAGIDPSLMNMPALIEIVKQAEAQFDQAVRTIRNRLRKSPFQRLIREEEKQLLHFTFYLHLRYQ